MSPELSEEQAAAAIVEDRDDALVVDDVLLADDEPLIDDELLVEEISIDGMCGVY